MLTRFRRNLFVLRVFDGLGLLDDLRLGFHFFSRRSGFDLRHRLGAAFRIALTDTLDVEIAGFQIFLGVEGDGDVVFAFQARQLAAFLVKRVNDDVGRDAHDQVFCALFLGFLFQAAQDAQRGRFHRAHDTLAAAMRAGHGRTRDDAGAQALARHLKQAELADLADLHPRAIVLDRVVQPLFDRMVVAAVLHVDVIDDDETGQVTQAQLAADLVGCFEVGLGAVSSIECSRVARPEFTSMETSASV